jgi:hypothetical protein
MPVRWPVAEGVSEIMDVCLVSLTWVLRPWLLESDGQRALKPLGGHIGHLRGQRAVAVAGRGENRDNGPAHHPAVRRGT